MLVKKYKCEVVSVSQRVEGIYTLEMRSVLTSFKYVPGQFLHLAMDDEYDGTGQWPDSRCFSIQGEGDDGTIKITYAVKGRFTSHMKETLKPGSEVWLKLPYGDLFTQPHNKHHTVFIAGGTGITPFLSLFSHEMFREYDHPRIYLGFRSRVYNIYEQELTEMRETTGRQNGFEVKIFYQDSDGILDIGRIFSENGVTPDYFVSGPPDMIHFFKKRLSEEGVPPGRIFTDDWE
jgi:NAD(P)H-flavin reductase